MKTEKTILYSILAIVLLNTLNNQCSARPEKERPKITTVRDTIWQTKTDTFKIQTTNYKTVYIDTTAMTKIVTHKNKSIIQDRYIEAKAYRDTISNADIDVFSYSLVKGKLLDSEISYKLKVPREVTITKTIEHPKIYRSGLYLFSEAGGNTNQFNNLGLGLQYNRKGQWFVSYRLNLNTIQQPTHNIGVGYRLFK